MNNYKRSILLRLIALVAALALVSASPSLAQENPPPQPIDLPCATNAFAQVLGMTPVNDGAQNLVLARIIFGEGGSILDHTHPGTLVVTIESGSLGFTLLDDAGMSANRAATAETEATAVPLPPGEEVVLNPGDWFIETGMVHTGVNVAAGETTVLLTGLIEAGQPLTICVEDATPVSHEG